MELDQLNRTQHELKHGSEQLEDILRKLEKEQVKIWNIFCFFSSLPEMGDGNWEEQLREECFTLYAELVRLSSLQPNKGTSRSL